MTIRCGYSQNLHFCLLFPEGLGLWTNPNKPHLKAKFAMFLSNHTQKADEDTLIPLFWPKICRKWNNWAKCKIGDCHITENYYLLLCTSGTSCVQCCRTNACVDIQSQFSFIDKVWNSSTEERNRTLFCEKRWNQVPESFYYFIIFWF